MVSYRLNFGRGSITMPKRWAWAEIDLDAVEHNIREIRGLVGGTVRVCAVVKANAYGHGAVPVARRALEAGANWLAVATLSEAQELRAAGFTEPILVLGLVPPEAAREIVEGDIRPAICDMPLARALSKEAMRLGRKAKVHLKVETGMGRIGVRSEDAGEIAAVLRSLPRIELEGIFSHFAAADMRDKGYTWQQLAVFRQAIRSIEAKGIQIPIKHIAESAAILEIPEAHFDMVRAGIIQYGLWPSEEVSHPIELRPAMRLCARIAFLKTLRPGESVSYGREFIAERECRIATLPIGYADGYIRAFAHGGSVELRGRRAPIVGRVCMDQVMVDVTDIPGARVGDEVTLFGSPTLTTDEAAEWLGTINYEVTCLVSSRVPRIYHLPQGKEKGCGAVSKSATGAIEAGASSKQDPVR